MKEEVRHEKKTKVKFEEEDEVQFNTHSEEEIKKEIGFG